jgi:hypothetical protein
MGQFCFIAAAPMKWGPKVVFCLYLCYGLIISYSNCYSVSRVLGEKKVVLCMYVGCYFLDILNVMF